MNLYSKHYWKLEKYKQNFEKMLKLLSEETDFEKKLQIAIFATDYFTKKNNGYFTSSVLENFFIECSNKLKTDINNIDYVPDSILHVMTQGYNYGGHTRVVERWIKNAPASQKHSVVLTNPLFSNLSVLKNNIKEKKGEFISLNNLFLKEKAIELRKTAMKYEYIILHTNINDIVPILAFGTKDFTRPILFYNHASHMAWIGKSIADLVLDIEKDDKITTEKRNIQNTFFLGVPSEKNDFYDTDKKEAKNKLNIAPDKNIIVSSGAGYKYQPIEGKSFVDYLMEIIDSKTYCYVIGIDPKDKIWKEAKKQSKNHIIPIKYINFDGGFLDYLRAADLYLDSYPLGGGSASIDAISSGTPVLSLKSVYPQLDYLTQTSAYCETDTEFINKAKKILSDKQYSKELLEELKNSLLKYQSPKVWNKRLEEMFKISPKQHCFSVLSEIKDNSEPIDLSVICNVLFDNKFLEKEKIKLFSEKEIKITSKYYYLLKFRLAPYILKLLHFFFRVCNFVIF